MELTSVDKLQIVIEGTSDYDNGSSDPLHNKKIETFNFDGLVAAFDAALVANPGLTSWALSNALLAQYLTGSDTAAIGGDLAYRYGRFDTLSDISFTGASPAGGGGDVRTNIAAAQEVARHITAVGLNDSGAGLGLSENDSFTPLVVGPWRREPAKSLRRFAGLG